MNVATLQGVMPRASIKWLEALCNGVAQYRIDSKNRFACFAGQLAHETAEFTKFEESLNYSAERLMQVWPKRFPDLASATPYARNSRALANKVYASRMGNGPEESGDGWLYRGRGAIQLTGLDNYEKYGKMIGVDLVAHPEKLLEPVIGISVAGAYWVSHGCNELADANKQAEITKAINGGDVGLAHRIEMTDKIRSVL